MRLSHETFPHEMRFPNERFPNERFPHERFPHERFPHEMRFPHEIFHAGDTILYKKHNRTKGNTKKQIFV